MKRISLAVLLGLALSTLSVRATTLFFDNFQQFANGTVLTTTNYVPVVGPLAIIVTNDDGLASTTVVASNFLGSTQAFFNRVNPPYAHRYRGELAEELTNQVVTLNWKMWIQAVKTPAATLGGIGLDLATTNLFIDAGGTNLDNNIFLFFNDAGQVFAFTNNASETDPTTTVVQIGSWSSLAGTVMTNRLVLNYPAGTLSFSINGTTLTNMPIPGFLTNIFDRIQLGIFEGFTGVGQQNSTGNRFALDDVWLTSGAASTNQEVRSFIAAAKGQLFDQLNAGAPSQSTTGFTFFSSIKGVESNSVVSASVQVPGGASPTLLRQDPGDPELDFTQDFTTKAALDAVFSNGTYTLTFTTINGNLFTPSLNLPTDNYPNTPQVANFAAAQTIDSTSDFTLTWNAFSAGTANDFILVDIVDALDTDAFLTPDFDQTNALNGTVTQVVIPGGTLAPGTTYTGRLIFGKRTALDTNTVAGAVGITAYYKQTAFPVTTLAPTAACSLVPALATNDVNTLHTVTATVTTNGTAAAGVTVNFDVTSGPNIGTNGVDVTDGAGQAAFSYTGIAVGTDTVQAAGAVGSLSFTGTATKVWLLPNVPPVAVCQDLTVPAGAGCQASVSGTQVDNGSSDSDGTIVSRVLTPSGPYGFGTNSVTLTVTDNRGGSNSCAATIVVTDQTPPTITCPANVVTNVPFGQTNAVVTYPALTISDNCSGTSTNFVPPSGSTFALGTNQVTVTATDDSGNTNSCNFNVIVAETPAQADLALTKVSNVATASLNNAFGYTLTVTNQGPQAATGAQLVDTLPGGVVFGSATSSVGSCTNVGGVLTCDFGTLANGATATLSVVVTPTNPAVASACNTGTVTSSLLDPVAADNSATVCTPVVINNLAVTAFKAPKKVALSVKKTNVVSKLSVTIQNRSLHAEVIPNLAALSNLVTITLSPLGSNSCPSPVAQLVTPKAFPITLTSGKTLKVAYTVNFTCATDPLATSKTANHNDYQYLVTVHHEALDGLADSRPADDVCPHNALGADPYNSKVKDKGCGLKIKGATTGTFTNVVTDITDSRTP